MKTEYKSPELEIVETIQSYCDVELSVSSDKLGGLEGAGNEDFEDFGNEDLN